MHNDHDPQEDDTDLETELEKIYFTVPDWVFNTIMILMFLFVAWIIMAQPAASQSFNPEYSYTPPTSDVIEHEVSIRPRTLGGKPDGQVVSGLGWTLRYFNQQTYMDKLPADATANRTEDTFSFVRTVDIYDPVSNLLIGQVTYRITRTKNFPCMDTEGKRCPDILDVLETPDGFIPVPQSLIQDEDTVGEILIVPALIG